MMGRKDTQNMASLSNRAPLWSELIESVEQHPVLGFGFEAFWTSQRVQKISLDQGWMVPHAHNTYLDQALSLGVIGSLLYTCTILGGCLVAWRRYRHNPEDGSLLIALLLTWLALLGLSESLPVAPNLPTLVAYVCLVKLCMAEGSEATGGQHLQPGEILPPVEVAQERVPRGARLVERSPA
jgi:O-antigen ligase